MNQQLKTKRNRVEVVKKYNNLEPEKKLSSRLERLSQRNTIDVNGGRKRGLSNTENEKSQSVRYRNRNNSISIN